MHLTSVLVSLATIGYSLAAGPPPVLLGSAGSFAILAESAVLIIPNSTITGDVGISPAAVDFVTGLDLVQDASGQFWTSAQVNGRVMSSSDAPPTPGLLTAAVLDMQHAFTDAMNRPNPNFSQLKSGQIGGSTLVPGIYKWTSEVFILSGITLTGGPTDTWIFQILGSLTQTANVHMTLLGGALPQNIFWAVAGGVFVDNNAIFQGNIVTPENIEFESNAVGNGCIYSQADVFLSGSTILCAGGAVTPPPSSTTSATPTSTATTTTVTPQCTQTPTSASCATVAFQNMNASIQGDDFLTFTLTDTVEECIDFCACIPGCAFANPNFDNAKNTTMLTCSTFSGCHTAADATNTGGQTLPDGSLSTITNSSGFCLIPCGLRR